MPGFKIEQIRHTYLEGAACHRTGLPLHFHPYLKQIYALTQSFIRYFCSFISPSSIVYWQSFILSFYRRLFISFKQTLTHRLSLSLSLTHAPSFSFTVHICSFCISGLPIKLGTKDANGHCFKNPPLASIIVLNLPFSSNTILSKNIL